VLGTAVRGASLEVAVDFGFGLGGYPVAEWVKMFSLSVGDGGSKV